MLFSLDEAEETVRLSADTSGKEEYVGWARLFAIPEGYAPQAINHNGAELIFKLTEEGTSRRIEGMDVAITEIADE